MSLPTHRERQFMQHLRGGGWVKASAAPAGELLMVLEGNYLIGSRMKGSRLSKEYLGEGAFF